MKVPYSWLQEFVADLPDPQRLADILDGLGLAVEDIRGYSGAAPGTVAVRLDELVPVSGSEHLLDATVFDGRNRYRVLTGAQNARPGMMTAMALPGVSLPALGLVVEAREMAGRRSEGMLLSPRELGAFDYGGGLVELPGEVEPGADLAVLWPGDVVLELELTPNRADAFSILGVARDVAAKLGVAYRHPAADLDVGNPQLDDALDVEVSDTAACLLFTLRRIDGLTVAPSPIWLQRRLASVGLRPRNNIVDVTNFVTFELGQPSHAYDLTALEAGRMEVRRARYGERLITLTGDELELDSQDLVIATGRGEGSRALGLAGVIGGLEDSVDVETTGVALEVAHFQPVGVRRTAKRHGISTDAHYRFERGVDPALPPMASARAAVLIAELAGGSLHAGVSRVGAVAESAPVRFRPSRVRFLMDFEVPRAQQRSYLEALGCEVDEAGHDEWSVTPPSWRFDIGIEEDLVEEVGRLHGYENIGETLPSMRFVPLQSDPTHAGLKQEIAGLGFQETIGYVFTSDAELARAQAEAAHVKLADPQGIERSVLRTSLYPGLLSAAANNRAMSSLALFEVGRVFLAEERERLALLARGSWIDAGWQEGLELDFFLFKGLLEELAARRGARLELSPCRSPHLHPGVSALVSWNGREVGTAGRLHPKVASRFELGETYLAELELPLEQGQVRYQGIPRQQHAERDVAVIAPIELAFGELRDLVEAAAGGLLESLDPFDVYTGSPIPEGMRSVALRLRFRHAERPLLDEEVDGYMENVIGELRSRGYDIRDR